MADDICVVVVRPELLGTYGDAGNATVLVERLRRRGIPARRIDVRGSEPVPRASDIVLLGGGEDAAQQALAADDALARSLERAVARGAVVLAVCAGFQLLGRGFLTGDDTWTPGWDLIDVVTGRLPRRAVGEIITRCELPGVGLLTGFENHGGATVLGPGVRPLGEVLRGTGNGDRGGDGAVAGRIVGTYLHGPVLARNPALADHLLSWITGPLPDLEVPGVRELRAERLRGLRPWHRVRLTRRLQARWARTKQNWVPSPTVPSSTRSPASSARSS